MMQLNWLSGCVPITYRIGECSKC